MFKRLFYASLEKRLRAKKNVLCLMLSYVNKKEKGFQLMNQKSPYPDRHRKMFVRHLNIRCWTSPFIWTWDGCLTRVHMRCVQQTYPNDSLKEICQSKPQNICWDQWNVFMSHMPVSFDYWVLCGEIQWAQSLLWGDKNSRSSSHGILIHYLHFIFSTIF